MYKKIKNNPLYNFIFRVVIVFILSSILWIFLVRSYYEEQISQQMNQEMSQHKDEIVKLLHSKPDQIKKEILEIDTQKQVEYLSFYNEDEKIIFNYEKDKNNLEELKFLIDNLSEISFEKTSKLIPVSKSDGYLYEQDFVNIENKKIYYKILIKLDNSTLTMIRDSIEETLIIVIITTLILFFTILPLVYAQYKSMIKKQKELVQSNINTLISLGNAVAKRDSDTSEHNYRVTYYSLKIAQAMDLNKKTIQSLIKGAFLHDVGKIAISDNILLKPAKLNDEEFKIMKTHVLEGIDIVKNDPWLSDAQDVILNHHEKVDGTGYPNGLKEQEIPIAARIFAVADVFDALTSKRPYKEPFSIEKSMEILHKDSGTHFDANVVKTFDTIHKDIHTEISNASTHELETLFLESLKPYFFDIIRKKNKGFK